MYAQNVNAVVAISNQATTNIYGQITETASSGSGFIITENGYVVTNYHVAEGATKLTVILHNGTEYDAKLVGYDSANDVAVLKVDATGLPFVKLGKSDDLIVGDQVVAIGNPLGELTNSLTVGYVSAIERSIKTGGALINMIQADVAINSGNSGGPLFNMKGEVVGITTAKYSGTSGSGATIEGISFAIPVDDVAKKVNDLVNYGYITGAYLGVSVSDTDPTYAEYFGIPAGAYVREVTKGYCAYEAGIKAKDVIVELGGYKITSLNDLSQALDKFNPGDTIIVVVYRGGGAINIELTLDERPKMTNSDVTPAP
ncbi:MAG: trypsin-like serine protease [Ruminococcaceae bacterium]|nr:trypsin-like serine protease [Oscillospiraceae bacterium]